MRYIAPADLTLLAGNELPLCKCVKMTLRDSSVLGFTDHDANLTIGGVTYRAKVGLTVNALRWGNRLEDERTELEGIFSGDLGGLTEALARQGYYNEATVEIFVANWSTAALIVPLKRGVVASVVPAGPGYTMEVRSLVYPLTRRLVVLPIVQTCKADLGDSECNVTPQDFIGAVKSSTDQFHLSDSSFIGPVTASDLVGGRFVLSGSTCDWFINQIKDYDAGTNTFTFVRPWPVDTADLIGVDFIAYEGCDKTAATCKNRFSNLANFRGFPHVPDRDKTIKSAYLEGSPSGYVAGDGEDD